MMVEKVPDSTYEMVGGLQKQIKEIKEVIELPVKHPGVNVINNFFILRRFSG